MAWQISGKYLETCNCDYLCPCVTTALAKTTYGYCIFAMGLSIERGQHDGTSLAGQNVVVVGRTPGNMIDGNWQLGLVVDESASDAQSDALLAIFSGQAGGPLANLAPLVGQFMGVERAPVRIDGSGKDWSLSAGKLVEEACEGAMGIGGQQMHLEGMGHPVNDRLALAKATKSHIHVFGIDWDQTDGKNNGHFAPFDWKG